MTVHERLGVLDGAIAGDDLDAVAERVGAAGEVGLPPAGMVVLVVIVNLSFGHRR
jgi:hypothetical protein